MIRFSFHTTRGAVIPRTLSSSEFAQKVVEYRWLVSDFATKQVWTHTGFASGGIPQWVIDASTANTLHVEASWLPEEAGEEKGAMEQGSASEEKKKKKKKKKKKTRDVPKAGATVQVEATEETEKGTEEVAKELSKGEDVEQHPTAGLTTEEVSEAEEELIEEENEDEVTEAEEEENEEEHPTGGHTTEEVTKEVKAMEERTDDPPAEQINDEVPKENEDTQDTLWTVKLTNTDELNRIYTVIGGRQKNVSDFLLSLSTAMTKLSTAVARVDRKVDEGFAKVDEIRRSQEKLEKSQEKLQKAVSDTHEIAVMSQLQQWVIQKCGRQPELPVGMRLPYVASARLENLGKLCLKHDLTPREVPSSVEIDAFIKLKCWPSDSKEETVIAEILRSRKLCSTTYKHPRVPECTPSSKLLFKFVQVGRGVLACAAIGVQVFAACIVSPSFQSLTETEKRALADAVLAEMKVPELTALGMKLQLL